MVSRGGRSKGCSQCRRRRVKCDEKRPTCRQCVKRGLECDGPKDLTWIDQNNVYSTKPESEIGVTETHSPLELPLIAFEEDICLAYTRKHLLRGGPVELACNMIDFGQSTTRFIDNSGLNLLRKSLLSLSVTFFGSQNRQDRITYKGYRQYGEVLGQLNSHLTQPEQQLTNETLLTALSCTLLEIFLPTGPTNFLKHQRGIETIMELRGPPTESTGTTATIFRGLRILSIVSALAESRQSIWARPEWKKAPAAQHTEVGLLQHQIFDVLADCTHLISVRDAHLASGTATEGYGPMLTEVRHVQDSLEALYPRWEALNRSQLAKVKNMSDLAKELGIASHVSTTAYMLYHTAYICILQIKESLSPSPDYIARRNAAALKIARSLELKEYEKREGAPQSNTIAFVATKVAWQALGGFNTVEGRRLAHVVKSSVNGVFRQPYQNQQAQKHMTSPTLDKAKFVPYSSILPTFSPPTAFNAARTLHVWEQQLDVIDIGHKQTSPLDEQFSLELGNFSVSP